MRPFAIRGVLAEMASIFNLPKRRFKEDRLMRLRHRMLCLLVLLLAGTGAHGARWSLLPQQSHLTFSGTYEGTREKGHFRTFRVSMQFTPGRPKAGKVTIHVDTSSVKMGYRDATRTIKSAQWLDVSRYPRAKFSSDNIREKSSGHYLAKGKLRLKGITKTIRLAFAWHRSGKTATMTGSTKLPASDFNLGHSGKRQPALDSDLSFHRRSKTVTLSFNIHLKKHSG